MSTSSIIHGQHIEVTVVAYNISSESSWVSQSHPLYVCFQYGNNTYITMPNQDGTMNINLPNKFDFPPIEGQSELKFVVWKSIDTNLREEDYMGCGRVRVDNVVPGGPVKESYLIQKGENRVTTGALQLVLQCKHAHSENSSRDPTLSSWPPVLQNSPQYPPLPAYNYCLPSYPPPPPHQYWSPYPPPPPYYPLPTPYYPPSTPYYTPPPPPQPLPPPRLSSLSSILPLATVASLTSIGASLFQFFV